MSERFLYIVTYLKPLIIRKVHTMTFANKFGMFIHWGLYSQLGLHEQAFVKWDIPRAEYEGLINTFNPIDYDPEKWVLMAKAAGMKYICFTAKHHDGFCMWDTKYTNYNIMHTPYGRDALAMLADACRKHGMLLSIYYSNPDWHYEYGYNPASTHQEKARRDVKPDTHKLREYIVNQITELMTNYGPIYTLFWDIPPHIEDRSINDLVRRLQPGILINNRGFDEGDFATPEREMDAISESRHFSRLTEACNSLGTQSWGYRSNEDFYSLRHIMSAIDRCMSMGASYLLNVGPDGRGVITEEYASRLKRIGDWYNRMDGCLEGCDADSFAYDVNGRKYVAARKDGRSYFHFYDGLISSAVYFKKYPSSPRSVRLMNTGTPLNFALERIPSITDENGITQNALRIAGIPVDDLAMEPIVIEVEW